MNIMSTGDPPVIVHLKKKRNAKTAGRWHSRTYSPIKLKKQRGTIVPDTSASISLSSNGTDLDDQKRKRRSEILERDNFLELLSRVQDNRINSQRCTLKSLSMSVESNLAQDSVFKEGKLRSNSECANGDLFSGQPVQWSKNSDIPSVEITDSPGSLQRKTYISISMGSISGMSEDSHSLDENDGQASSSGSPKRETRSQISESPENSIVSPSRKSMAVLKKVIDKEGPYPLLINCPNGGFWIQNGDHQMAYGKDGVWRALEISTEHYTIQTDNTLSVYGRYFKKQEHQNFIGRDLKHGPVLVSLKLEDDFQGTLARVLLRTQKETIYKTISASQLPSRNVDPEEYFRIASLAGGEEILMDKAIPLTCPKVSDLLQKFDEHPIAECHKFGVIYQKYGQTCEEELFGNIDHPDSLDEFLNMLGTKVELKGFSGYRGGLDVTNNQTGQYSVYTEFMDRNIMFHVSTLLPHDQGDNQYVQKKRHIGNDIVVIIFQEENTPFCPDMIRSHFVHSYIVVQVEHPNTDHTVYKVAITAKDEVPTFGPPLPEPAIFQKGGEFRDWLLIKALNAEFNCHQAPSFKKLATRTRNQLFVHLFEEIVQSVDEADGISLGRDLTASLDYSGFMSHSMERADKNMKKKKTFTGMFGKKDATGSMPVSPMRTLSFKRKSNILCSPKDTRKLQSDSASSRHSLLAGSSPDLLEEKEKKEFGKDGQRSIVRRFTFKRNTESDKVKRRAKRASSMNEPRTFEIRKRAKERTSQINDKRMCDSSEASSVVSVLGGSVPYDLPGAVENDQRRKNSLVVMPRPNSAFSIRDVNIVVDHSHTNDIGIQCQLEEVVSPMEKCTSPRLACANSEHSRLLYSVHLPIMASTIESRSLPGTPVRKWRKSRGLQTSMCANDRTHSPTFSNLSECSRKLFRNKSGGDLTDFRRMAFTNSLSQDHEVESIENLSTSTDHLYSSLLKSVQVATAEVVKVREENYALTEENVRCANQNHELQSKYSAMKEELEEAKEHIKYLNQKLKNSLSKELETSLSIL